MSDRTALPLFLALAACHHEDPPAQPGPVMVGAAEVRMPVPVGIGTAGYGAIGQTAEPSPFADRFPATTRVHGHPTFQATVISRGPGFEVAFLRTDTVGIFQQFREAVVLELDRRMGRDMDDALVIGATHTHSGPGRVIDGGGLFDLIADTFFPEFYDGMVMAMADAVEQAYADLKPGRVGYGVTTVHDAHNDRRCEDGLDYENGSMPFIAVEQDGVLRAIVLAYAAHGTILGMEDLTLSADVAGGIEQQAEDGFDHPVQVTMLNSWGADMAPGDGNSIAVHAGAVQPDGYERMLKDGGAVRDGLLAAIPDVTWLDDPAIDMHIYHPPVDREHIGYASNEFPYVWGGVYCSTADDADCDAATTLDDLDHHCIPFPEAQSAPRQTELSVGHIGDLRLVTFPGEPGTLLAEALVDRITAIDGDHPTMFIGYAQDYIGYSILEDDWWQGGYEASGAIWGPKQGQYLSDRVVESWTAQYEGGAAPEQAPTVVPFDGTAFTPYAAVPPTAIGTVQVDALATYTADDVVSVTVSGSDPWLGAPVATVIDATGAPVLRNNGLPFTSDGYGFWVDLAVDPPYRGNPSPAERRFDWTFHMPAGFTVDGPPVLNGTYTLSISLPTSGEPVVVQSAPFAISG